MGMMRAIALLGGGAEGFIQGRRDAEADQRARDDAEFRKKQQQFTLDEQARTLRQRAELEGAAAPVQATPDMEQTPEGPMQRMIAPAADPSVAGPPAPSMSVGGKTGLDPGEAKRAVESQNSPEAIGQRQAAVVQKYDPERAAAMQASLTSQRAAKLTEANQAFDAQLNQAAAQGWPALNKFTSDSGAHPAKSQFVPAADGKTGEIHIVQPDGTLKPTGMVYENSTKGAMEAAAFLSRMTPIQAKVAHLLALQKEGREGKAADALARYHDSMAKAATTRADAASDKASNAVEKMPEHEKLLLTDISKQLETINTERVKAQAGDMWQADNPGAKLIAQQEASLLMRRDALLAKYQDDPSPASDPAGLRSPKKPSASGQSATTRPPTSMETVVQDMVATGTKSARFDIGGKKWATDDLAKPAPAKKDGPMASAVSADEPAEGKALDAAKQALAEAKAKLNSYGLRQRQADPKGFESAQAAVAAAKAAADEAMKKYQSKVGQSSAAFSYAKP